MQRFKNEDGQIRLKRPFPKRMSWAKALELSIQKWEFVLEELDAERRANTTWPIDECLCALCEKSYRMEGLWCNSQCPVSEKTYQILCRGTPYPDIDISSPDIIDVVDEIDFLKSLRE